MKSTSRIISIMFFYILQIIIFCFCFLIFTSTIRPFPWYEPLTMGAVMLLMIITPIQVMLSLIIYGTHKSSLMFRSESNISILSAGILLLALFIVILNEVLFHSFAIIGVSVECLLTISLIFIIIRRLSRNKR